MRDLIVINKYKDPADKFYMILAQALGIGYGVDVLVVNDNPAIKIMGDGFYALNHKVNLGISASRNEAIEFAQLHNYDTIYFIDGDDELRDFTTDNYIRSVEMLRDNDQIKGILTYGYDRFAEMKAGSLVMFPFTDTVRSIIFRVEDIKDLRFEPEVDLGEDNLFMLDFGANDPETIWGIGYVRYIWLPRAEGLWSSRDDKRRAKFEEKLAERDYSQ